MHRRSGLIALALALALGGCASHATPPPRAGFYSKSIMDGAIRIAAHDSVSDEALVAARATLEQVLARAPEIRRNLEANELEMHVMGRRQLPSELPENVSERGTMLSIGEPFDFHMRGGHFVDCYLSCTEGWLLGDVTDLHYGDNVCVHELGHAIDQLALGGRVWSRIIAGYRTARTRGRPLSRHAELNEGEYFAEATRLYFTVEGAVQDLSEVASHGREWLRRTDPDMFDFVDGLYSGRTSQGRVVDIAMMVARQRPTRSARAVALGHLVVRSELAERVEVRWVDEEGHYDPRGGLRLDAGKTEPLFVGVGHLFVVLDGASPPRERCWFTADADAGRVVLWPDVCG